LLLNSLSPSQKGFSFWVRRVWIKVSDQQKLKEGARKIYLSVNEYSLIKIPLIDFNFVDSLVDWNCFLEARYIYLSDSRYTTNITLEETIMPITNLCRQSIKKAASATVATVAASATVVTVLAANTNRIKTSIFNTGIESVWVKFGTGASVSDFSIELPAGFLLEESEYTGTITGICGTGKTSSLVVTEFV
jgi:hypothetical protein